MRYFLMAVAIKGKAVDEKKNERKAFQGRKINEFSKARRRKESHPLVYWKKPDEW